MALPWRTWPIAHPSNRSIRMPHQSRRDQTFLKRATQKEHLLIFKFSLGDAQNRGCSDSTCWLGGGQQGWLRYSQDLRDRVIDAVVRGGMSRRAAAARFGVSESSAIKWVQRFERSGSRAASKMGGYLRPKLEPHREFLEALRAREIRHHASRRFATGCWPSAGSKPTPR